MMRDRTYMLAVMNVVRLWDQGALSTEQSWRAIRGYVLDAIEDDDVEAEGEHSGWAADSPSAHYESRANDAKYTNPPRRRPGV